VHCHDKTQSPQTFCMTQIANLLSQKHIDIVVIAESLRQLLSDRNLCCKACQENITLKVLIRSISQLDAEKIAVTPLRINSIHDTVCLFKKQVGSG
jgi:hypothetical protein